MMFSTAMRTVSAHCISCASRSRMRACSSPVRSAISRCSSGSRAERRRSHRARYLARAQRRRARSIARARCCLPLLRSSCPGRNPRASASSQTFIDTAPDVCTSLLVDRLPRGRQRIWAVVAAFGDNLADPARAAAAVRLELNELQLAQLQELGECINYNAYGDSVDDLNYHPAESVSDAVAVCRPVPVHQRRAGLRSPARGARR